MLRKHYEVTLEDYEESGEGLFATSLVTKPAIGEGFIFYSEQSTGEAADEVYEDLVQAYTDAERGIIVGPVMIPNKKMARSIPNVGLVDVSFTPEVIESALMSMSKSNSLGNFTIQHQQMTGDVHVYEMWIKESVNDKSTEYGYADLPVGTAFMKAKVEDEQIKELIKSGELRGFSVEMKHGLKLKTENYMSEENQVQLYSAITSLQEEVARLSEAIAAQNKQITEEPTVEQVEATEEVSTEEVVSEVTTEETTEEVSTEEVVSEEAVAEESTTEEVVEEPVEAYEETPVAEEAAPETVKEVETELSEEEAVAELEQETGEVIAPAVEAEAQEETGPQRFTGKIGSLEWEEHLAKLAGKKN